MTEQEKKDRGAKMVLFGVLIDGFCVCIGGILFYKMRTPLALLLPMIVGALILGMMIYMKRRL